MSTAANQKSERDQREPAPGHGKAPADGKSSEGRASGAKGPNTKGQTVAPTPKQAKDEAQK